MARRVYSLLPIAVLLSLTFSVSAARVEVTEGSLGADATQEATNAFEAGKITKSGERNATEASCPDVSALVGTWKVDRIMSTKSSVTQYWKSTFEKWIQSRRITISTRIHFDDNGKVGAMDMKPNSIVVNIGKDEEGNTRAPPIPRSDYVPMNCWCDQVARLKCGMERDEGGHWVRQLKYRPYDYVTMKKNKEEVQHRGLSLTFGPSTSDGAGTSNLHVEEEAGYSESIQKYGEFDSYFKKISVDSAPGDDWVQLADASSGHSYWYHQDAGAFWGKRPPAKPWASKPKSKPKGPPAESAEDTDLARATNSMLRDLKKTQSEPEDIRKSTYKKMAFQWHPDKNPESDIATLVFQFLQQQKEWYLPEQ